MLKGLICLWNFSLKGKEKGIEILPSSKIPLSFYLLNFLLPCYGY